MSATGGERSGVFRVPGFASYWSAYTVSAFGSYVTSLALQVLVVALDGSATDVGLVSAARWAPYLVLGLVVGALVDRRRRRPIVVGSDLGRFLLLAAIAVLGWIGWLGIPLLLVLVALVGLLSLTGDAASQALLPRIVPRTALLPAHARTDQSDAVAQTTGPLVAGALVSLLGAATAVVVDALSYLFSAVAIARIRLDEPPSRPLAGARLGHEIAEGLRWVYRHRTLGPMAVGTHLWFLFNAVFGTAFVSFALIELGLDAFQLGVALAGAGVAGLIGSSVAPRIGRRWGAGRAVIASNLVMGLGWAVVAAVPSGVSGWLAAGLLCCGQLLYGLGLGLSNSNEMAYRQALTPDELQARTNTTIRSVNRAMIVVGAPLGGVLATALGYQAAVWIAVAGLVVATAILALSPFRYARHAASDTAASDSPASRP
ncbi:MFS transporter [Leifsonia sp. NPDC080035]|uniref:MFS transporter n=1 Tax=Leifsonia sp. NPDC080035 TaxID=3143936 RepID=A0AAU7GA26_9MICO